MLEQSYIKITIMIKITVQIVTWSDSIFHMRVKNVAAVNGRLRI